MPVSNTITFRGTIYLNGYVYTLCTTPNSSFDKLKLMRQTSILCTITRKSVHILSPKMSVWKFAKQNGVTKVNEHIFRYG